MASRGYCYGSVLSERKHFLHLMPNRLLFPAITYMTFVLIEDVIILFALNSLLLFDISLQLWWNFVQFFRNVSSNQSPPFNLLGSSEIIGLLMSLDIEPFFAIMTYPFLSSLTSYLVGNDIYSLFCLANTAFIPVKFCDGAYTLSKSFYSKNRHDGRSKCKM